MFGVNTRRELDCNSGEGAFLPAALPCGWCWHDLPKGTMLMAPWFQVWVQCGGVCLKQLRNLHTVHVPDAAHACLYLRVCVPEAVISPFLGTMGNRKRG